jgi:Family of unknown function (DUF5829)
MGFTAFAQQSPTPPPVQFNHLYFVINVQDLSAIKNSPFITKTLCGLENRTTNTKTGFSWTGTYLYSPANYIELFDTLGLPEKNGVSGIGFSVDGIGELKKLNEHLRGQHQCQPCQILERDRDFGEKLVRWYDYLVLHDSATDAKLNCKFWVMEYKQDYFAYKKLPFKGDTLSKENYLVQQDSLTRGKLLNRFTAVTLKLNQFEREMLLAHFRHIGYKRLADGIYAAPGGFRFTINDRPEGDNSTIEQIAFATIKRMKPQEIRLTKNVVVRLSGKQGVIVFKKS